MNAITEQLTSVRLEAAQCEDMSLFPTPVRILRWQTEPGFNERLSDICAELFERELRGRQYSEYDLWSYDYPEIAALRRMFEHSMRDYIETQMNPRIIETFHYRMRAWLRIEDPGELLPPHAHPEVHFVGTYYPRVTTGGNGNRTAAGDRRKDRDFRGGDLMVLDPRPGIKVGFEKSRTGAHAITPETGMMILMPYFLMHWVVPISEGDHRICIPNNMILSRDAVVGVAGHFKDAERT